ncbi:MAG: hypothetical protein NUV96_00585 [Candidatus Colwellbacteria bacterium]|nr:hypothetical protein [Candidatus Colwellbacteria bacterium]
MRSLLIVELPSAIVGFIISMVTHGFWGTFISVIAGLVLWAYLWGARLRMTNRLRAKIAKDAGHPELARRLDVMSSDVGRINSIWMWSMNSPRCLEERRKWAMAYRALEAHKGEPIHYPS